MLQPAPPLSAPGAVGAVSGAPRLSSPRLASSPIFFRLDPAPLSISLPGRGEEGVKEKQAARRESGDGSGKSKWAREGGNEWK